MLTSQQRKMFYISMAFAIAYMVVLVLCISYLSSIPTVSFSYSTGDCIKVLSKYKDDNCENIPEKYNHIWIK